VAVPVGGVGRAGHQPTIGPELCDRAKPLDVVDLEVDRERHQASNAGNPEQTLHPRRVEQRGLHGGFQRVNLLGKGGDQRGLAGGLHLVQGWQVLDLSHVPPLEQAIEAVLGTAPPGDHAQPRAEDVAGPRCASLIMWASGISLARRSWPSVVASIASVLTLAYAMALRNFA
jgi:hypothetical protein